MKLIEAMKQVKALIIKADDLRKKIALHSAHLSIETPVYKDQAKQVREWLQSHEDIMQEICGLKYNISKTNLGTLVEIELGGKKVKKTIMEWIERRRTLAPMDLQAWSALTDRNLREGNIPSSSPGEPTKVIIMRCYDPVERDAKRLLYTEEPGMIDRTLEVVNATTDLLG